MKKFILLLPLMFALEGLSVEPEQILKSFRADDVKFFFRADGVSTYVRAREMGFVDGNQIRYEKPRVRRVSRDDGEMTMAADVAIQNLVASSGEFTLIGNVRIYSKEGKFRANRTVIHMKKGEIDKIVSTGNPVVFDAVSQKDREGIKPGDKVYFEARESFYYPNSSVMVLKGNVVLKENTNQLNADRVKYNLKTGDMDIKNDGKVEILLEDLDGLQK